MGLLDRLLGRTPDDRAPLRPVWQQVVAAARSPQWYARADEPGGVPDTMAGRFDVITAVLSLVLLRMEEDPDLIAPSVRLTEIFVEDMDGQLRESGVGDVVVGKHIGRLMSVLGGRLGAYRAALAETGDGGLEEAVRRNVTLGSNEDAARIAGLLRALAADLRQRTAPQIMAGQFGAGDFGEARR